MDGNPARPNDGFDGYDLWRLVSYAGTAASVVALFLNPKQASQLGKVATGFGAASAAHALLTPPRCGRCGARMSKPTVHGGPAWVCRCGAALYPASQ